MRDVDVSINLSKFRQWEVNCLLNPSALKSLHVKEVSGKYYFSGTPLTLGEMSRQLPGGKWERCLRPFMPVNGSLEHNHFVPDAEQPVVCVTSLAQMAVFRALSHQSLHTNLPKHERKTGWRHENGIPIYMATAAVQENIHKLKRAGIYVLSTVVCVRRDAAVFEPFPREPYQFRTSQPVPFATGDVIDVSLDLWPDYVEECQPWPVGYNLDSYDTYNPESAQYLDELYAERRAMDSFAGGRYHNLVAARQRSDLMYSGI